MSSSPQNGQHHAVPIPTPVATHWLHAGSRGLAALAAGLVIAFTTSIQTPALGLAVFAGYTVVLGLVSFIFFPKGDAVAVKNSAIVVGAVSIIAAGTALFYFFAQPTAAVFILIVSIWAAVTGFAEIYLGFSKKQKFAESRDWLIIGSLTGLLALATVLIDPNFRLEYMLPGDGVAPDFEGAVTGSLNAVGTFGVYLIIVGLLLLIGAYSLKEPSNASPSDNSQKGVDQP